MHRSDLVKLVLADLVNERMHMAFYLQSAVQVRGLHREELGEWLLKEAHDEFEHVHKFSRLIVHLGGSPSLDVAAFPKFMVDPVAILTFAREMEDQVATNYAERLRQTEDAENADTAAVHVFYEDQIRDSWETAREIEQMLKGIS